MFQRIRKRKREDINTVRFSDDVSMTLETEILKRLPAFFSCPPLYVPAFPVILNTPFA